MNSNRRGFIRTTAVLTAAFAAFPTILRAGSANEKIVVGLVGCNGMGFKNLKAFLKQPNVECVALCDVDQNVLEKRAAEVEKIQGKKPILYTDFRKLLDNRDIDAVVNATPDHWHALVGIYAMEAGKDLYTEKPLAKSIQECDLMVAAQKRYNKVVQVGQWQRSNPHRTAIVEYLNSGNIGKISAVRAWSYVDRNSSISVFPDSQVPKGVDYNFWLGPAPLRPFNKNRFHFNFRWNWDYGGGIIANEGTSLLDLAMFGMNKYEPDSVMTTGGNYAFHKEEMETPDTCMAVYDFEDFSILWDHAIGTKNLNFGRDSGVAFLGEAGTLIVDKNSWEVIPKKNNGSAKFCFNRITYQKGTGEGLNLHVANFIDCIKTRNKPNCDIEIGAHIARISHFANISHRLGRKVFWDSVKQEFINDAEANEMIRANYRYPWELPKV